MRTETNGMFPSAFGTKEWGKAVQRMTIIGIWSTLDGCVRSFTGSVFEGTMFGCGC